MLARQAKKDRRHRRLKLSATLVSGATAALVLTWLSQTGPGVTVTADSATIASADRGEATTPLDANGATAAPTSLLDAALADLFPVAGITVHETDSSAALAAAFMVRDGYLISSGLTMGNADEVTVRWGESSLTGQFVGYDEATDISVIRVDDLPPGDAVDDAANIATGDRVTVAAHDESENQRTVVDAESTANVDGGQILGVVELDSSLGEILPGSPAFNENGALIGVAAATDGDSPMVLMPISVARGIAYDIIDTGAAHHARLGIRARSVTDDDETTVIGSLVTAVVDDGPAAAGGMHEGDVIVEIDGNSIDSVEAMVLTLHGLDPGDEVAVVVDRDGETVDCSVVLASVDDADDT